VNRTEAWFRCLAGHLQTHVSLRDSKTKTGTYRG